MASDVIVFRAPRQPSSGEMIGKGLATGLQGLEEALLVYSQQHDKKQLEKLAMYDKMMDTYKDQAPQAMLSDYNRELKSRYGPNFGLPKDPATGEFLTKSPSVDEVAAREFRNNPKLIEGYLQTKFLGVSPLQMKLKEEETARRERHDTARDHWAQINAEANVTRARLAELKAQDANSLSPFVMYKGKLTDRSEIMDENGNVPAGTMGLTVKQADQELKRQQIIQTGNLRQAQIDLDGARIKYEDMLVTNFFHKDAGAALMGAAKIWANPKWNPTPEQEKRVYNTLTMGLRHAGVEEQDIEKYLPPIRQQKGFFARLWDGVLNPESDTGRALEEDRTMAGIMSPEVSGTVKAPSGRTYTVERADNPDAYDARMRDIQRMNPEAGASPETGAPSPAPEVTPKEPVKIPKGMSANLRAQFEGYPDTKIRIRGKALVDKLAYYEERANDPNRGLTPTTEPEAREVLKQLEDLVGEMTSGGAVNRRTR